VAPLRCVIVVSVFVYLCFGSFQRVRHVLDSDRKRVVMLIHAETFRSQYLAAHSVLFHTFTRHIFCSPRYLCCSSLRQLGHTLEEVLYSSCMMIWSLRFRSAVTRRARVGTGLVPLIVDAKQAL